jgi:exosome complex RNA-binding protein Rrp4
MKDNNAFIWDGLDCNELPRIIGHQNFWHKKEVLIVLNKNGVVYLSKGDVIEADLFGNIIGKISSDNIDKSIINSVIKLLEDNNLQ